MKLSRLLCYFLLCATPLQAQPPMVESWLQAESILKQPAAFDSWMKLYETFKAQPASLDNAIMQHDVIAAQLVALSLRDHDFALADEMTSQVDNKGLRLYLLLATYRANGIYTHTLQTEPMVALLPEAKKLWGESDQFQHFLNALVTALMDTATEKQDALSARIIPLVTQQKIARHRAYALHRLHLYQAQLTQAATLDVPRVEALIATKQYDAALHTLAISALHQRLKERNRLLLALHEATREHDTTRHIALPALWLILKDKEQERALVDYTGWLTDHGMMPQAVEITDQLNERKAIIKATYHLRDGYEKLKQEEQRKATIQRIDELKSLVTDAPLADSPATPIDPFQKLHPYYILANARTFNAQMSEKTKANCAASALSLPALPQPFDALSADDSYGTDDAGNDVAWTVMLLASRTLGGDLSAQMQLKGLLIAWAQADALEKTISHHNALYALKRVLLPFIQATSVVESSFTPDEKELVLHWLESLTHLATQHFNGKEVEVNNHRYLADAVLLADGILRSSPANYNKGKEGFYRAIAQIDSTGNLPLEMQRGSRALWYMRQSLATLTTMAVMMQHQQDSPSAQAMQSLEQLAHRFITLTYNPLLLLPDAAANVTAGAESNIFITDMGMLSMRPHLRHYMAFAEYWRVLAPNSAVTQRFNALLTQYATGARPWIDEFAGGNATCYTGELQ